MNDAQEFFPAQDLLPPNATPFMRALSQTSSRILDADSQAIRRERDPTQCDAHFTPFLAWERSVHHWVAGDIAGNRAKIASSFEDHLSYGTPVALESEIAHDTGQTIEIVEFFQDPTLVWPYFWVCTVVNPGDPPPNTQAVWKSAILRKNVRDMPGVRIKLNQPGAQNFTGAATAVSIVCRFPPPPPLPQNYTGARTRVFNFVLKISPEAVSA